MYPDDADNLPMSRLFLAVLLLAAGCRVSEDRLHGTWRSDDGRTVLVFRADHTLRYTGVRAYRSADAFDRRDGATTWRLESSGLTLGGNFPADLAWDGGRLFQSPGDPDDYTRRLWFTRTGP